MGGMVREEGEGFIVERFECRTRILGFYFVGDVKPSVQKRQYKPRNGYDEDKLDDNCNGEEGAHFRAL